VAAEIERALGTKADLVKGSAGVFDVAADGKLIYSRHRTGRFPAPAEIVEALRKLHPL
jgi:selT/selW/selH-like putative selenoprotein